MMRPLPIWLPSCGAAQPVRRASAWVTAVALAIAVGPASASASDRLASLSAGRRQRATTQIELRPSARVEHEEVRLGEVASVASRDPLTQRRLAELPIGRAPLAGRSVRVDRAALIRWIRVRAGVDPGDIEWVGSPVTEISLALREVSGETIAREAEASLREALSSEDKRIELSVRRVPQDVTAPLGRLRLEPRPVPQTTVVPRRLSVWMDVRVDDRFVRTVPVDFEVRVFGPALVTSRDRKIGEAVDPAALEIREVEWSGRPGRPVDPAGPEAHARLRLRHSVAAGGVLDGTVVERAPAVARGEWALLRSTSGSVTVESRVEILEDGNEGNSIRVKLANAAAPIVAKVTGPGRLEIAP